MNKLTESYLRLKIKNHWDFPQNYEKTTIEPGVFAGRIAEKDILEDLILRKPSGSVLVSGARGVGKTSLIYKTIFDASQKNSKISPVIISASQLDLRGEHAETVEIFKNLIKRFYYSVSELELKKEIKSKLYSLYEKTVASDWKELKNIKNENLNRNSGIKLLENITNFSVSSSWLDFGKISGIIFTILSIQITNQWFRGILILLGIFTFLLKDLVVSFSKNIKINNTNNEENTNLKSNKTEKLTIFDNSIGNLEEEFRDCLYLIQKDHKVVFVIDELDDCKKQRVLKLIKTYKNLFSLTPALFIFITDEVLYKNLYSDEKLAEDEKFKTIFTDSLFLSRPDYKDIEAFLDNILNIENNVGTLSTDINVKWKSFKHYLAYKAGNDFFALFRIIKDYIKSEGNDLYLFVEKTPLLRDLAAANFHKAMTPVYSFAASKKPTNWHDNEKLLNDLFNVINVVDHTEPISVSLEGMNKPVVKDLINRLKLVKAITDQEISEQVSSIAWSGDVQDVSDAYNDPFPHENELIEKLKEFDDYTIKLNKYYVGKENSLTDRMNWLQSQIGTDVSSLVTPIVDKKNLILEGTHIHKDDANSFIDDLSSLEKSIKNQEVKIAANYLISKIQGSKITSIDQYEGLQKIITSFEELQKKSHQIVCVPSMSKNLIIINNYDDNKDSIVFPEIGQYPDSLYLINISEIDPVILNKIVGWFNDRNLKYSSWVNNWTLVSGVPLLKSNEVKLNIITGAVRHSRSCNTFITKDDVANNFKAEIAAELSENSVLDIVFRMNIKDSWSEFYIARVDTRQGEGCSFLKAEMNQEWQFINRASEPRDKVNQGLHKIILTVKDSNFEMSMDGVPILSHIDNSFKSGKFGLFNELNDVLIRKVNIKKVRNFKKIITIN